MRIITEIHRDRTKMACVLALGMFDGVHTGHRELIDNTVREARKRNVESAILTFDKTPVQLFFPERQVHLLTTTQERARRMAELHLNRMYLLPFTRSFAAIEAEAFLDWMRAELNPVCVVAGYDYSFGAGGKGNTAMLREYCDRYGIDLVIVPPVRLDGEVISSTRIRKALQDGELEEANHMLGYAYSLAGTVTEGKQTETQTGFPVLNITLNEHKQLPAPGVYTCILETGEKSLCAVVNIGTQSTASSGRITVEVCILQGAHGLPGSGVRIVLTDYLREELCFSSPEELQEQIDRDMNEAQRRLHND